MDESSDRLVNWKKMRRTTFIAFILQHILSGAETSANLATSWIYVTK